MPNAVHPSLHEGELLPERHGAKAAWLARAARAGENVPPGFVLDVQEAARCASAEPDSEQDLVRSLERLSRGGNITRVAVRSSPVLSLPGALLTQLDVVAEPKTVLAAVRQVVLSSGAAAAREQLEASKVPAPQGPWNAVLVQAFIEASDDASFGAVLCTRDPSTGAHVPFGEFVAHRGADAVVSGRSRPLPLSSAQERRGSEGQSLERSQPEQYRELCALGSRLEEVCGESLELELVHARGVTWLLQARPLVLSARGLARVALEAVRADAPTFRQLLRRVATFALRDLVEARLPPPEGVDAARVLARGLAASPGVGRGVLVLDVPAALDRSKREPVVLARRDAVPEDVAGLRASVGLITTTGGLTSHAAVIARGLRVPAVVGARELQLDLKQRAIVDVTDPRRVLAREGELVSLDGHRGILYRGEIPLAPRVTAPELEELLEAARKLRRVALWVRGEAVPALAVRELGRLDGVICVAGAGSLPTARGRDVWVEVDVAQLEASLEELPAGYGVVLCGAVTSEHIARARELARLRPLGVRVARAPTFSPSTRLDLLLVDGDVNAGDLVRWAPRIVRLADPDANALAGVVSAHDTLACAEEHALELALSLAAVERVT